MFDRLGELDVHHLVRCVSNMHVFHLEYWQTGHAYWKNMVMSQRRGVLHYKRMITMIRSFCGVNEYSILFCAISAILANITRMLQEYVYVTKEILDHGREMKYT